MQSIVDSLLLYKGKDWRKEKDFDTKNENKEWQAAYVARKKFAFTPQMYKKMMVSKIPINSSG